MHRRAHGVTHPLANGITVLHTAAASRVLLGIACNLKERANAIGSHFDVAANNASLNRNRILLDVSVPSDRLILGISRHLPAADFAPLP